MSDDKAIPRIASSKSSDQKLFLAATATAIATARPLGAGAALH